MQQNILAQKPRKTDHWSGEKSNVTVEPGSPIMRHSFQLGARIISPMAGAGQPGTKELSYSQQEHHPPSSGSLI